MLDLCKIWIVYSLMPFTLICQSFDISIAAVASNYGGEMTDGLSSTLTHTHPGIGLGLKYRTGPVLSFELSAVFAHLSGDDKDLKDPILQLRNIHFRSNIREYAICTELNILPFFKDYPAIIEPYVNLGLGAMHFNPQAMYNGEWIDLQPLGTEGQGLSNFPEKYSLWTFVFFPSIGLRYNINEHWSCALELGFRKSNTDYIDDTSGDYVDYETLKQGNGIIAAELGNKIKANKGDQRGSIANKDYYNIGLLKCSYTLLGDKYDGLKPRPSKKKNAGDRLF